jgi:quinol monooxygenase YgiN
VLLITGTFRVPPERLDEARPAMSAMVAASRAEAGCLEYSYAADLLDPGLIRVIERWSGRAALEAHFAAPHIREWRAAWPELGIGERDLAMCEVDALSPI